MNDDSNRQAGATKDEIEVTPAMIEAGLEVFGGYDEGFEPLPERLAAVFRAMFGAMYAPSDVTICAARSAPEKITPQT